MREVQEILAGFVLDSDDAAIAAGVGPVGADQVCRKAVGEAVSQHIAVSQNKKVGERGVAAHVLVDQLLQRYEVVDQDFVGGLQNDLMREIFGMGGGGRVQDAAVAVGDQG